MNTPSLGIDLAQHSFVAALWLDSRCLGKAEFANHGGGFRKLRTWLQRHGVGQLRVGLESTSTFGEALAQWLYAQGHQVFLLNPERTNAYGRSLGQRNKTDPADAVTIAQFVARHDLTPWQPPAPEQKTLRSLTRARHQLVHTSTQLRLQLKTAEPVAQLHLQAVLAAVTHQLSELLRAIKAHLRAFPQLEEQVHRLMTVKGVGFITAAITIAELPPVTAASDPRALCAWAGLVPRRWQSGKSEGPTRLSRKGNVFLREALYMPALVAKRYNPLLRDFARRLALKGKSHGSILGALAHKLLRILVGLLRSKVDFDPNWSSAKS